MPARPDVDPVVDAYDQLAVRMYDLDAHPGLALCRSPVVAGLTAQRWKAIAPDLPRLWTAFTHLGGLVTRIRDLRGTGRPRPAALAELTRLVSTPVVGLDDDGVPVPDNVAPALRCTVPELLELVQARYTGLLAFLSAVDDATDAVAARVGAAEREYASVTAIAATVGAAPPDAVEAVLSSVRERVGGDPLGADVDADLARVDAALTAQRQRLAALVAVRDGLPARLGRLHGALDELAEAEKKAAATVATAREKTLAAGLDDPTPSADRLHADTGGLDRLVAGQSWEPLARGLDRIERDLLAAHDSAVHLTTAAEGLLARREELRGRLRAYEVKAARLGLAEAPELVPLHTRARELLGTRPCDLAAATRALSRYQQVLAGLERTRGSL